MIGLSIIILVFVVILAFDSVESLMSNEHRIGMCIFLVVCAVVNVANMFVMHKYGVML